MSGTTGLLEATRTIEQAVPTSIDAQEAQGMREALCAIVNGGEAIEVELRGKAGQLQSARIPMPAVRLLMIILDEMSRGNMVNVVPVHAVITTQEAADMLNISRPSVVALLDGGAMPFTRVKKHRRIRVEDVIKYKAHLRAEHKSAMEELAALDQELGL